MSTKMHREIFISPLLVFLTLISSSYICECFDPYAYSSNGTCSSYHAVKPFELSMFLGEWNYLELFSVSALLAEHRCMKLTVGTNDNVGLDLNVTIPNPNRNYYDKTETITSEIKGIWNTDATIQKEQHSGRFKLISTSSLASSDWIILHIDRRHVIYLICGDLPGNHSIIGEVAILSRGTILLDSDRKRLLGIPAHLKLYTIVDNFKQVSHNSCMKNARL